MTSPAGQNTADGLYRACSLTHAGEGSSGFPGTLIHPIAAPSGDGSTGSGSLPPDSTAHGVSSLNSPGLRAGGLFRVHIVWRNDNVIEGVWTEDDLRLCEALRGLGLIEGVSVAPVSQCPPEPPKRTARSNSFASLLFDRDTISVAIGFALAALAFLSLTTGTGG